MTNTNLDNLTKEEKELVASILKEYSDNGTSSQLTSLLCEDFDEIPVDIETFIDDKKYLGNALIDAEGRKTLFPYWREKLKEIFPDNIHTAYNTVILTGAIGLGKTLVADIILLYMLYRLLCLKDPYLYYGMQPIDKLTISFMNITLENAKGVALDKMNQMLMSSSWFMSHGSMRGITNLEYVPNKHIELVAASSNNQIVGRALFCLDGETYIKTEQGYAKLIDLVNKKRVRVYTLDKENNEILSDYCSIQPTGTSSIEYEIELEDGTTIKCTPEHKFMLKDGSYKEAQYLTEEDELYDL